MAFVFVYIYICTLPYICFTKLGITKTNPIYNIIIYIYIYIYTFTFT